MGQKIHPHGFRLGYTADYVSNWYADGNKPGRRYRDYVEEDVKIRRRFASWGRPSWIQFHSRKRTFVTCPVDF